MTAFASPGDGGDAVPFSRVAIIGSGLIGGSVGLAVKARWPSVHIVAIDRQPIVDTAVTMGAADGGGDDLALAAASDLVVLAAPVGSNIRTLGVLAAHVPGQAVVTDVGSTKRETVAAAAALPPRLQFVGGHPVAGAAVSGVAAARADLFVRRPWILTPSSHAAPAAARLARWVEGMGARVHCLTPDAHDALVAFLSHLPQLTATALMHVVGERVGRDGLALSGRGLRDTTRLASSQPAIWRDIARTNQDNLTGAIDALIAVLSRMRDDLGAGAGALDDVFESSASWKRALEQYFET